MCDTIVVVRQNGVLFAKNSDRDANEAQALDWQPAGEHPSGSVVQCTWIRIPQVERTHACLLSRPFWMFGAEMGANEHGVTIGNEAVFTREPLAKVGLTGMDLLRLALERSTDARQAVDVIAELLERHGQGGGCGHEDRSFSYHNSFIVADRRGAFVVETAGRHVAIEPVVGARTISNGLTIDGFAQRHSDMLKTTVSACRARRERTQSLAERAHDVGSLMALLRDHGEEDATPHYHAVNGAMSAACMHAGGLLASSQTTSSWVAELSSDGDRHWVTASAAPCVSLFKPVRVHEPLPDVAWPGETFDAHSRFWRGEQIHRAALRNPARLRPLFIAERDLVEAEWRLNPPEPVRAFSDEERMRNRWIEALRETAVDDVRPGYVRRFWEERNRRANMPAR